jgi:hypothetical protein
VEFGIFILDACRDNPFEAVRDIDDNGLAEMNAPTGTFLAYATAPGAVALDGAPAGDVAGALDVALDGLGLLARGARDDVDDVPPDAVCVGGVEEE